MHHRYEFGPTSYQNGQIGALGTGLACSLGWHFCLAPLSGTVSSNRGARVLSTPLPPLCRSLSARKELAWSRPLVFLSFPRLGFSFKAGAPAPLCSSPRPPLPRQCLRSQGFQMLPSADHCGACSDPHGQQTAHWTNAPMPRVPKPHMGQASSRVPTLLVSALVNSMTLALSVLRGGRREAVSEPSLGAAPSFPGLLAPWASTLSPDSGDRLPLGPLPAAA